MKFLIVIVVLVGLSAVFSTILVGKANFEGLVVDRPYDRGLQWDARQKEKAALGWGVEVRTPVFSTGDQEILCFVYDKNRAPLSDAAVSIVTSRPSTMHYDRRYETVKSGDGLYAASVHLPLHGYWDLKITVAWKGRSLTFEERIYAGEKGDHDKKDHVFHHH